MSGTNPANSAQPPLNAAYTAAGNPVTGNPEEQYVSQHKNTTGAATIASRGPGDQDTDSNSAGMPSSLGYGVHSDRPVNSREAAGLRRPTDSVENESVNAEQLATFSEGKVADAVEHPSGANAVPGAGEPAGEDFAAGLDRKKAEQAAAREAIQQQRHHGVNVDGGFGTGPGAKVD